MDFEPDLDVPPWRLAFAIDASSAAIRSGTSAGSSSGSWTAISLPSALRSIISSTATRYSSRYLSGSNSAARESMSCMAIATSFLVVLAGSTSPSPRESGDTTSSPNSSVSMVSTPSRGRMATRFSLERMTTRAIATRSESLSACSSSA